MGIANKIRINMIEKLTKLVIILDTPGAFQAKRAGCFLSVYQTLYSLFAIGLRPMTVLDIGANRGMFARTIHYLFPNAEILAFEPLIDCYNDLCNLKQTISTLECYNFAVGDQNGEDWINRSSYDFSSSILKMNNLHKLLFPYSAGESLEKINKIRLDSFLGNRELKRPILLKIDVQGYEKFVLEGSSQILQQVDYILCELSFVSLYEQQPLFNEMYTFLIREGFEYLGHIAENREPNSTQLIQIDGLFVREKRNCVLL